MSEPGKPPETDIVGLHIETATSRRSRAEAEQPTHAPIEILPLHAQQYRTLIEALPQLVWMTDAAGMPVYFNQPWIDYTAFAVTADLEENWAHLLHPDDMAAAATAWQRAIETGEPYEVEYRLRRHDGVYRWFLVRGVPLRDEHGRIDQWFGTCTDIDRPKREEEKQRFLARLSSETRALASPDEVMGTVIRLLGEHLRASRTTYNEVEEASDRITIHRDYCTEGENQRGTFPLSALGAALPAYLRAGRTVIIPDTATDPRTAPVFETVYQASGIRSFIAVPLLKEGKLTTILSVNMRAPRDWTADEAALVEEVAERTWPVVQSAVEAQERRRAEQALHASETRYRMLVEQSPLSIQILASDGRTLLVNRAWEQLWGLTLDDIRDYNMLQDGQLEEKGILSYIRRAFAGEAVAIPPVLYDTEQTLPGRTKRADSRRWTRAFMYPVKDEAGSIREVVLIHEDISEQKRLETRQRFLAQASDLLASSLDYQTTLQSVAQLAVPHLADWCGIHLVAETGDLELVTVTHVDPAKVAMAWEAARRYPPRPDATSGLAAVVRSGKSEWLGNISEETIRAAARDEEHYHFLMASGLKSYLCVPLTARGRTLGAITFVGAESGHRYGPDDVTLAEELARRAAIAVDNARLYQAAQHEIAERQRAEAALAESRDYYRSLIEAVPQLVWTTRPDGVPDYFNRQWLDYTGQTPDDTNAWWRGSIHPDDLARTTEHWNIAVQTGEPYEIEYRLRRADGAYLWFLARGVPLKNERGEIRKWFGTCTLIEDQKRAEQAQRFLAELSERIRPLSDPPQVLWEVVNALGRHLRVTHCTFADVDTDRNQFTVRRDYHWKGESHAGTFPLDWFGAGIVTALLAGNTFVVQDTCTDPRTQPLYEAVYRPNDIRAFVCVPLIKEGRWIAVLSVTMHGQPRAWTEEEIGLVEKVMEQTWLAVENARLYQSERERSEQLALAIQEVHHRVKNNLQAVSALLEMQIAPETTSLPIEAVQDSLSQIKTIALVHDLLARDKPMGGVNVAQVLTNLATLLSTGMRRREQPLAIRVDAEPVWLSTKAATSLALIANELLTNAEKHHKATGRKEENGHASIEVSLHRQGENLLLAVQDSGPGFPPDFDPVADAHIGLQLVLTLVEHDLRGSVAFTNRLLPGPDRRACGGRVEITLCEQTIPE